MEKSQHVIVELTTKIPLMKKYIKNHGEEIEKLLIALSKINCKCLLIGPTYTSLRDGDPYHFRVQIKAAFSSPRKKELTYHFTSSNATALIALSGFFRQLREKLEAGYTITEYKEPMDFNTAVWYRFNRKTFLFEQVTLPQDSIDSKTSLEKFQIACASKKLSDKEVDVLMRDVDITSEEDITTLCNTLEQHRPAMFTAYNKLLATQK